MTEDRFNKLLGSSVAIESNTNIDIASGLSITTAPSSVAKEVTHS